MRKKLRRCLLSFAAIALAVASCKDKDRKQEVKADTTINKTSSFNNLFLDSSKIDAFLAENPSLKSYEKQFNRVLQREKL